MFWNDNGCSYGDLLQQEDAPKRTIMHDELTEDARRYQESFNDVLQENMKCVQHHIHKKCPKTGERRLPNACVSYTCKTACKHGFPQTEKMNLDEPLLICKGLAKEKALKATGSRNLMGCILGKRNCEWLNGTAPALCLGFSGGNSDVKLNDRLPITAKTHEAVCKHKCVPVSQTKRKRA